MRMREGQKVRRKNNLAPGRCAHVIAIREFSISMNVALENCLLCLHAAVRSQRAL